MVSDAAFHRSNRNKTRRSVDPRTAFEREEETFRAIIGLVCEKYLLGTHAHGKLARRLQSRSTRSVQNVACLCEHHSANLRALHAKKSRQSDRMLSLTAIVRAQTVVNREDRETLERR